MLYIKDNIIKDSNLITIETEDSIIYNPDHDTLLSNGWEVYKEKPNTKIIENKGFVKTTSEEFGLLDKSVYEDSIVFIEDTKQIWSNDVYYGTSNIRNSIDITYSELVSLRDNSQLIPGMQYRITDYVATTTQEETMSANHPFDIIILALDNKTISEEASAIQHEGDTYFANSNLNAWKLWYSLDNDKSRFVWADEENGKGVIYRMIDEFNNDVAYDFKGILFVRTTGWFSDNDAWLEGIFENFPQEDKWFYTFSWINKNEECEDLSIIGNNTLYNDVAGITGVFNNIIKPYSDEEVSIHFTLPDNIFISTHKYEFGMFYGCYNNTLNINCYSNTFGNFCNNNTFGEYCYSNTFGNDCSSNAFGNECTSNTFGNDCSSNTFGNECTSNTFGNDCSSNTFGNDCNYNNFKNDCASNTFGNDCNNNSFLNDCVSNTFGNDCSSNNFQYVCQYNSLGDNCVTIRLITTNEATTNKYHYYKFTSGLRGLVITLTPNLEYETKVAKRTNGEIVVYNEADLVPWTYISE